jgi:hypothetical protein
MLRAALSKQTRRAASRRTASARSAAAKKAVKTKASLATLPPPRKRRVPERVADDSASWSIVTPGLIPVRTPRPDDLFVKGDGGKRIDAARAVDAP